MIELYYRRQAGGLVEGTGLRGTMKKALKKAGVGE